MGSWNSIQQEITSLGQPDAIDVVRRKKIDVVSKITGRPLVIYATDFANPLKAQLVGNYMNISLPDKLSIDEVTRNLPRNLGIDIMLHSPGGSAEATESVVDIIRSRFSHVRFVIPDVAKSAATMMAMSGNQLLMDEISELGPTDPQMMFTDNGRNIFAPAQAIKDQFNFALREISKDPSKLPSWLPILRMYGPSLLTQCDNHITLSRELVSKWLRSYMFVEDADAEEKAERIAEYLSYHNNFLTHERRVGISDLQSLGVNVLDMHTEPILHEAVRDLYIAIMLTFGSTNAYKIAENNQNEAIVGMVNISVQQNNIPVLVPPQQRLEPPSNPSVPRNRHEEKRKQLSRGRK